MRNWLDYKLVVAISSRALFDLEESHRVFLEQGVESYCSYQRERENEILARGVAFPLVRKLLALNEDDSGDVVAKRDYATAAQNYKLEYGFSDGIIGDRINHVECDDQWVWFSTNNGISFYNWEKYHYEK